ncbi:MAG: hypothetical protein WKF37_11855 [Bryobacteraceae bacterium]
MVKTAIDRRTGGKPLDSKLLAKVQDVSTRYDAWLVSIAPVNQFAGGAPNKQTRRAMESAALQGIEQTSGGVRFGNIVQVDGEAVTRSDKDAQALVDVIKFLTGMMQLSRDNNPEVARFADLLQTLDVKASANLVKITFSLPQSDLEQLFRPKSNLKRAAAR